MIFNVLKFVYTFISITFLIACMRLAYRLPVEIRKYGWKKYYILLTITSALVIGYKMILV